MSLGSPLDLLGHGALAFYFTRYGLFSTSIHISPWVLGVMGYTCSQVPLFSKQLDKGLDWVAPAIRVAMHTSLHIASGTPLTLKAPVPELICL